MTLCAQMSKEQSVNVLGLFSSAISNYHKMKGAETGRKNR